MIFYRFYANGYRSKFKVILNQSSSSESSKIGFFTATVPAGFLYLLKLEASTIVPALRATLCLRAANVGLEFAKSTKSTVVY